MDDLINRQEGIKAIWITSDLPNTRFIGMAEYEECEWLFDDYMDAYVDVTLTACMPNQNRGGNRNENLPESALYGLSKKAFRWCCSVMFRCR